MPCRTARGRLVFKQFSGVKLQGSGKARDQEMRDWSGAPNVAIFHSLQRVVRSKSV